MTLIALDKQGNRITTESISEKKRIRRGQTFQCPNCSSKLDFINAHERSLNQTIPNDDFPDDTVQVSSHFRHKTDQDCFLRKTYDNYNKIYNNAFYRYWLNIYQTNQKNQIWVNKNGFNIDVINEKQRIFMIRYREISQKMMYKFNENNVDHIILSLECRMGNIFNIGENFYFKLNGKNNEINIFEGADVDIYIDGYKNHIIKLIRDDNGKLIMNQFGLQIKLVDTKKFILDKFNVIFNNFLLPFKIKTIEDYYTLHNLNIDQIKLVECQDEIKKFDLLEMLTNEKEAKKKRPSKYTNDELIHGFEIFLKHHKHSKENIKYIVKILNELTKCYQIPEYVIQHSVMGSNEHLNQYLKKRNIILPKKDPESNVYCCYLLNFIYKQDIVESVILNNMKKYHKLERKYKDKKLKDLIESENGNLYDLCCMISFEEIDKVFLSKCDNKYHPFRVNYCVKKMVKKNNLYYIHENVLINHLKKYDLELEKLNEFIKIPVVGYKKDENICAHMYLYYKHSIYENTIKSFIKNMKHEDLNDTPLKTETLISLKELNHKQTLALNNAINNPISILTGDPGTGKTVVIVNLFKYFRDKKISFHILTFTGTSSNVIKQRIKINDKKDYNTNITTIDSFIIRMEKNPWIN